MSNGTIRYDFAGLSSLSGDLKSNFARLEDLSAQLKRQVAALSVNWSSNGAAAYQTAQSQWDRIFDDARLRLDGLGTGVSRASSRMQETDQRVGRSFNT